MVGIIRTKYGSVSKNKRFWLAHDVVVDKRSFLILVPFVVAADVRIIKRMRCDTEMFRRSARV